MSGLFIRKRAWGIVPSTSSLGTEGSTPKSALKSTRGPPSRTILAWPFAATGGLPSPAAATAFLAFAPGSWPERSAGTAGPGPLALAAGSLGGHRAIALIVGHRVRSSGKPSASTRASTIWSDRSRLGQLEANAVLPAALAVDRTRR